MKNVLSKDYERLWSQVGTAPLDQNYSLRLTEALYGPNRVKQFSRIRDNQTHNETAKFNLQRVFAQEINDVQSGRWRDPSGAHPRRQSTISRLFPRSVSATAYLRRLLVLRSLQLLLRRRPNRGLRNVYLPPTPIKPHQVPYQLTPAW